MTPMPKLQSLLSQMVRAVNAVSESLNRVACLFLFCMMLLTLIDVLLRKFCNSGILGGFELMEFMLVGMVFCALAQAEIKDRHVRVNLVSLILPTHVVNHLTVFVYFMSAVMMGTISISTFHYAHSIRKAGEVSLDLGIPRYPLILVAALGCALLGFTMLIRSWMIFRRMRRP